MANLERLFRPNHYFPDRTPRLYYPIGNTVPVDVTLGCQVAQQCNVLLLGCGDIRNVLYTIHAYIERTGIGHLHDQVLNFHLNDKESGILARDLLLFKMAKTIDLMNEDDMEFLWRVWYDQLLSKSHLDRLKELMQTTANHTSGDDNIVFGNDETERSVKNCLASWLKKDHNTEEMVTKKLTYMQTKYKQEYYSNRPAQRVASRLIQQYHPFEDMKLRERYTQEVQQYIELGITRVHTNIISKEKVLSAFHGNVTFFPPDCSEWIVPDDSCPFMCYDVERALKSYDGVKQTIAEISYETLKSWVKSLQGAGKKCNVQLSLWLDDAMSLCEKTLPEDVKFDFIDTSNLSDSLGLIPLLVYCQSKLKEDTGVLRTETFYWASFLCHGEYFLRICLDIPPLMYPTVIGLHLAEELQLGHEAHLINGAHEGWAKTAFRWKRTGPFTPCLLTGSDGVSKCLEKVTLPNPAHSVEAYQQLHQHFKVTMTDETTKNKLLERIRRVTEKSLPSSKDENAEDGETILTVEEFTDRYLMKIKTSFREATAKFSWNYLNGDRRKVIITLVTSKANTINKTLQFSCPVSFETKSIQMNLGMTEGIFIKDENETIGERVLPWKPLTTEDIANIPDYPKSEFSMRTMEINIGWVYPRFPPASPLSVSNPSPLHQLQEIYSLFLAKAPVKNKCHGVTIPNTPGSGIPHKFVIMVDGLKLWEQKPTTFVRVYDAQVMTEMIHAGQMSVPEYLSHIGARSVLTVMDRKLLQGYEILSTILKINSCRLKQDPTSSRWKMRSFVRMRFPFRLSDDHFAGAPEGAMNKDPVGLHILREVFKDYAGATDYFSDAISLCKPVCDFCGEMKDCKKCMGCQNVFYCRKECQQKAWPKHKLKCKK